MIQYFVNLFWEVKNMNIDPVAFTLGPITVRWYGLLIATAMLIAAVGGCRAMRKAGAVRTATGENAVVVNCRHADVIVGPIGIVIADALLGEITPAMAAAVCQSGAKRVLIPVNHCDNYIVGVPEQPIGDLVTAAVQKVTDLCGGSSC